jgi:hypothetical protein
MMSNFFGLRPDVTPAQLVGVLLAGVPVAASLLRAFGVYDLSRDQQQALRDAGRWGAISAVGLFVSDAGLRAARNHADAMTNAASLMPRPDASLEPPLIGLDGDGVVDEQERALLKELEAGLLPIDGDVIVNDEEGALLEELDGGLLPTDAEEFGDRYEPETGISPDDPETS